MQFFFLLSFVQAFVGILYHEISSIALIEALKQEFLDISKIQVLLTVLY